MDKAKVVYDGVSLLGFFFFVVATFLCMCLSGICTEDWLTRNIIFSIIAEVILFIWIILRICKGRSEIIAETNNFNMVKDMYKSILILSGFGILFACMWFIIEAALFEFKDASDPLIIYAFNVLGFSSFFFIWMSISIYRINRKLKH